MILRCIDFETTGLPDAKDGAATCEIGWRDIEATVGTPELGPPWACVRSGDSFLVNPGRPIPPEARAVHQIGDEDVLGVAAPADGLRNLNEGAPEYFVAHNAKFEQAFFDSGATPWICTYKVALRLWPEAPSHGNQVLRYWLGLAIGDPDRAMPPHRAGPDAYITAHILAHALHQGRASIDDMARWSSGPPLLPRIMFGKHRGARWEDIPPDYLAWIVDKSDMDADIKANARHHLKPRPQP